MGLTDYTACLLRRWRLVVAGLLLGTVAGAAAGLAAVPQFTSSTQLFVSSGAGATDVASAVEATAFSTGRVASYAQLLVSRELATRVVDELGLPMTPGQLTDRIQADVVPGTVVLDVSVTDPAPIRAQRTAEAVIQQFGTMLGELESNGSTGVPITVSIIAAPDLPSTPSSVGWPALAGAGLVLGLLLGALAAVLRDRTDTTVRSEAAAAVAAAAPALGGVPDDDAVRSTGAVPAPGSPLAESFGLLEANLRFVSVDSHPRVIMVTSADESEGKTTTVVQLAGSLARTGTRVLLIDADLRRPRVAAALGLVEGVGLSSALTDGTPIAELTQPVDDGTLSVLGAGPTPPNPAQLLSSAAMRQLLAAAAEDYDLVLVDTPPVLPVADAAGLAGLVDGVLLVARHGRTRAERLARARAQLDRAGASTLGVVLVQLPRPGRGADGYGYGYGELPAATNRAGRTGRWRTGRWPTRRQRTTGRRRRCRPARRSPRPPRYRPPSPWRPCTGCCSGRSWPPPPSPPRGGSCRCCRSR